ncbi:hypothetical protein H8356DRAFT_1437953 [Neocallimastix lanati (nom. inval.)]|nr:hypothetical protein H8356DRAFT_1438285 [Neocallimastix sp. JGI-2020a]KAG4082161.1 hypothetical protein H8356DRAFT_1437953 [Neocallimastix sp. JGI-2020a]
MKCLFGLVVERRSCKAKVGGSIPLEATRASTFYIGELNRNNIVNPLINPWRFVFSDSNKLTLFITKVFGYRPGNNSSTFNVSTHEGAGTFQALANKELTSPKANWASGL